MLNAEGLRYDDEFAKHKNPGCHRRFVPLGKPLLAAYSAFRSGHAMNNDLLRASLAQPDAWEEVSFAHERQAPAGFAQPLQVW